MTDPLMPPPPAPALPVLTAEEARVLGALIEKSATTPEYYPLSLNALVMACNQKNNRAPVVAYDETTVVNALDDLRAKHLVSMVTEAGARVPKYKTVASEQIGLDEKDAAILAELLLRGPQTPGELRNRADRMAAFTDLAEVQTLIDGLAIRPAPLVVRLPRQPGMKECRYAHLLGGPVQIPEGGEAPTVVEPARVAVNADRERITALERDVAALREEWIAFKKQFE
jgi:uncharacterized protein YceH (UPF0502 family)